MRTEAKNVIKINRNVIDSDSSSLKATTLLLMDFLFFLYYFCPLITNFTKIVIMHEKIGV
jgi:flagellar biosynthesis protein FliP